jgi:SAM-dependent methyltransferase
MVWKLRTIASFRSIASRSFVALKNAPTVRRAIQRGKKPGSSPKDWFYGIDDETWLWMNMARGDALANLLPKMPDPNLQALFTGQSGDSTLKEGFNAYRLFKNCYETRLGPIGSCRRILDFGCGWGRIIRFFLKDVATDKLVGVDHSEEAVRICKETNRWCYFMLTEPYPPTPLGPDSFDLIYLYSVFSHLPEEMHWALLKEFHRLLAPGGMLIATTRGREFIDFCDAVRNDPKRDEMPPWQAPLGEIFRNKDETLSAYDGGKFCYEGFGEQGRWSFWGEACIPIGYVQRRWSEIFDVCDYIDDRKVCLQNVIVARKGARNQ